MSKPTYNRRRWFILVLYFVIDSGYTQTNAKDTHSVGNFRCSHVPPTPEQVTHLWLDDAEFTTSGGDDTTELKDNSESRFSKDDSRKRRQIGDNLISPTHNDDLFWGLFKKQQSSTQLRKEDLVPMKIHIHYDESVNSLDEKKFHLINNTVMPSVVSFFESVLSIRKEHKIDTFKITRRCPNNTIYYAKDSLIGHAKPYCMEYCKDYALCGEVVVPTNHLSACSYCNSTNRKCVTNHQSEGEGVSDAQLVLYVSARQTPRCKKDQTIAYAAHCAQDSKTDRPVAGHANLCPMSLSSDSKDLKALIATVKHELTHVLGFSISLFAYYRDEYGNPLTERESSGPISVDPDMGYARWSDKIIKKVIRTDWLTGEGNQEKEIHMVVTPTVVREVRQYFNCSSLEGAELEDQGFDGTSMTHWEKRLFENEAMTGTHTQNSVYSRITLALLQDTGWYVSNFSKAEKLEWGKNLGCNFAKKSCKHWIESRRAEGKSIRPFCDRVKGDVLQISCTDDRASKAVCNMKQYNDQLPLAYQNFDQLDGVDDVDLPFYGGSVDLADYCPFIQEFTWQAQNVTVRGSRCDFEGSNQEPDKNAALEIFGPQTKCFEHGRRWEQSSCVYKRHWHHFGAGCYKFTCQNNHYNILVGNHSYPCYYPNQVIKVEQIVDQWLYNGTIICPACEKICQKCNSYDKKLIDNIFYPTDPSLVSNDIFPEDKINTIIADDKQKSSPSKPTNSSNYAPDNEINQELDKIIELIAQHNDPPKESLVCSSSSSPINHRNKIIPLILVLYVISKFISVVNHSLSELCNLKTIELSIIVHLETLLPNRQR